MEVKAIIIITFLFFCLSMLLSPVSSATAMQIQKQPPVNEQGSAEVILSLPQLPRKLRFLVEKQTSINEEEQGSSASNKEKKDASSTGEEASQRMVMHGSKKGRREERAEGTDTSNLFSMDYSHVKRRRPIHNKSLPVGP